MKELKEICKNHKIEVAEKQSDFWNLAIPIITKIQSEGVTFLIKADGERESNVFTILLQGGILSDDYYRCEADSLEYGINKAISYYAENFWS